MFLRKGVLKICSKFTGAYRCRSAISIKLLCNKVAFPVNFANIWRTSFLQNNSLGVVFKKSYIVGVHKEVFQWLGANELLSSSKNYLRTLCLHFLFLHFLYNPFFLLIKFLKTSARRKIHSIKLIGSDLQNIFFCRFIGETFRYEHWFNYEIVCVSRLEFLRTFLRIFVAFVNAEMCEFILFISGSTDYEFPTATSTELSKF